jgi:hypothetical protein
MTYLDAHYANEPIAKGFASWYEASMAI